MSKILDVTLDAEVRSLGLSSEQRDLWSELGAATEFGLTFEGGRLDPRDFNERTDVVP